MTIVNGNGNGHVKMTWPKILGGLTVFGAMVAAMTNFNALAEMQPFATKTQLAASLDAVRWDQLAEAINSAQFQLDQKKFQLIQLNDLIKADNDQTKRQFRSDLEGDVDRLEERLRRMRCQWDQRSNPKLNC